MPDPTTNQTPVLAWRAISSALNYKLVLDDSPDFSSPLITQYVSNATTFVPFEPLAFGRYYWRLASSLDYGAYSTPDTFTVKERIVSPPTLIPYPHDTTTERVPVFMWQPVPSAVGYTFQISSQAGFTTLLSSMNLGSTRFAGAHLPFGAIYWRVSSNLDTAVFSAPDSFVVIPFGAPRLMYPLDLGRVNPITGALRWSAVRDPSSDVGYNIEVSTDETFRYPKVFQGLMLSDTSLALSEVSLPPTGTILFWRVQAQNRRGLYSAYSATSSFVVGSSDITTAQLHQPAPVAHGVAVSPEKPDMMTIWAGGTGGYALDVYSLHGSRVLSTRAATGTPQPATVAVPRSMGSGTYIARLSTAEGVFRNVISVR